jgi:hypothetical protein
MGQVELRLMMILGHLNFTLNDLNRQGWGKTNALTC